MSNGEKKSIFGSKIRSFVLTTSFRPKNSNPDEWRHLQWNEWRQIRLKELLAEEEEYWLEKNRKELKEWEWIELGKENFDKNGFGKPFENEVERYLNIVKRLEGIERSGSKIYPDSLTQNRYDEGYIILASTTAESRNQANEKEWALKRHLNEKKAEFEKELKRVPELLKKEKEEERINKLKREEEERINRLKREEEARIKEEEARIKILKKQEEERIKWEKMTDEEKEKIKQAKIKEDEEKEKIKQAKIKEDESRRKEVTKLLFKKK